MTCGNSVIKNIVGLALAGPYTIIHEMVSRLFRGLFKPESSRETENEETNCLLPLSGAASSSISLHR